MTLQLKRGRLIWGINRTSRKRKQETEPSFNKQFITTVLFALIPIIQPLLHLTRPELDVSSSNQSRYGHMWNIAPVSRVKDGCLRTCKPECSVIRASSCFLYLLFLLSSLCSCSLKQSVQVWSVCLPGWCFQQQVHCLVDEQEEEEVEIVFFCCFFLVFIAERAVPEENKASCSVEMTRRWSLTSVQERLSWVVRFTTTLQRWRAKKPRKKRHLTLSSWWNRENSLRYCSVED